MVTGRSFRNLILLTLFMVFCVVFVMKPNTPPLEKKHRYLLPDLLKQAGDIQTIQLATANKQITIDKNDNQWIIKEKQDFPANFDMVSNLVLGLGALEIIEAKTQQPELYGSLQVDDISQAQSEATLVTIKTKANEELASVLIGKRETLYGRQGQTDQLYIRKKDQAQSWLVKGAVPGSLNIRDWVEQPLLPINTMDIKQLTLSNKKITPLVFSREQQDGDFSLNDVAENKKIESQYAVNRIPYALADIRYEDILSNASFDQAWEPDIVAQVETFNGLQAKFELAKIENKVYAKISSQQQAVKQEDDIDQIRLNKISRMNQLAKDWIFILSSDVYDDINKSKKDLLVDKKTS